jgi:hypothetical protein
MLNPRTMLKLLAGAVLFAAFVFGLMAAPGFLSAPDSIVRNPQKRAEAVQ